MAAGPQVTQRVRGDELEAVVTKADVSWDGAKLKRVWEEAPEQIRNEILRISEVKVNERTWSVWEKTTGSEEFERWKLALKAACKGRTGLPTVKVVESSKANKLSDMF